MRHAWFLALLAVALGSSLSPARAGEERPANSAQEAQRRFALGTLADVAWGAWLAAEHGLVEFRGEVVASLKQRLSPGLEPAGWFVEAVLLDAAIRLRVPAGAIDLRAFALRHPETVVVLATAGAVSPASGLGLLEQLDLGDRDTRTAWVALGNYLRASRTPGFAAWVLRQAPVEARLAVFSPQDTSVGAPYPTPPTGTVRGCGVHRLPPGLPPIPRYWIKVRARARGDPAAPENVVSVSRSVEDGTEMGFASSLVRGPARRGVLCGWLRDAVEHARGAGAYDTRNDWALDWTGRQPWARYLQPRVDAIHVAHWALVGDLVTRGYVTADEARTLGPALRVEVIDHRRDMRRALPPVPPTRVANPWLPVRPAARRSTV